MVIFLSIGKFLSYLYMAIIIRDDIIVYWLYYYHKRSGNSGRCCPRMYFQNPTAKLKLFLNSTFLNCCILGVPTLTYFCFRNAYSFMVLPQKVIPFHHTNTAITINIKVINVHKIFFTLGVLSNFLNAFFTSLSLTHT